MIDIIPNWHPIFVHFTVALLTISAVMFVVETLAPADAAWRQTCLKFARWNLWLGAGITVITLLAGWQAYNTVAHDTPSHAAMTDHKNWALVTAGFFALLALWSFGLRKKLRGNSAFTALMSVAVIMLGTTAWKGGEVVYRYGLGVMSMPQSENTAHSDAHGANSKIAKGAGSHSDHGSSGNGAAGKIANGAGGHSAHGSSGNGAVGKIANGVGGHSAHGSNGNSGHGATRKNADANSYDYNGSTRNYAGEIKNESHSH